MARIAIIQRTLLGGSVIGVVIILRICIGAWSGGGGPDDFESNSLFSHFIPLVFPLTALIWIKRSGSKLKCFKWLQVMLSIGYIINMYFYMTRKKFKDIHISIMSAPVIFFITYFISY